MATGPHPRGVAQLVARLVWDQEVVSSNPTAPTLYPLENKGVSLCDRFRQGTRRLLGAMPGLCGPRSRRRQGGLDHSRRALGKPPVASRTVPQITAMAPGKRLKQINEPLGE